MPTIPAQVYRVVLKWGNLASDWVGEVALNTFALQRTDTGGAFGLSQPIADALATKLTAAWTGIQLIHGTGYGITEIKVAALDTSGHVTDEGVHEITGGALNGTATGGIYPPEVAVAFSLYGYQPGTFATRRGTKRGRIYLPYIAKSVGTANGKIDPGAVDTVQDGWGGFFNHLAPLLVSGTEHLQLGILSSTAGTFTPVTYYAVDDHFDSQRRRQHQNPPVVDSRAVVPA